MNQLQVIPCLDSEELASARRKELSISREVAAELGKSAVELACSGVYTCGSGQSVSWREAVQTACAA